MRFGDGPRSSASDSMFQAQSMRSSRTISNLNGFWVYLCWDSLYRCLYDLLLKVVLVLNPKPLTLHPKPFKPQACPSCEC